MYDLIVIGAGPGGYVAAIRAAQLGKKVALIEKDRVGGTCLNRGCIPTKALMHTAETLRDIQGAEELGIVFPKASGIHGGRDNAIFLGQDVPDVFVDFAKMHARKDQVVEKLVSGVESLIKANGIDYYSGTAKVKGEHSVSVELSQEQIDGGTSADSPLIMESEFIIVATGSRPTIPNIPGIFAEDAKGNANANAGGMALANGIVTSDDVLTGEGVLTESLAIIGGGVIGVEIASIYNALGADVTIIEAMDRILPTMDKEISQTLSMILKKRGVKIHTSSRVQEIVGGHLEPLQVKFISEKKTGTKHDNGKIENVEDETTVPSIETVSCAKVLIAIGRTPNTENIFDDSLITTSTSSNNNSDAGSPGEDSKVVISCGFIETDTNGMTGIKNIYAIGDIVLGGIQLAHAASAEAINAVETMFAESDASIDASNNDSDNVSDNVSNSNRSKNLSALPSGIYTDPEIASVGLTEAQAKEQGIPVIVGKAITSANGKSVIESADRGYVKLIFADDASAAKTADTSDAFGDVSADRRVDNIVPGALIGAQIVSKRATDMIGGLAGMISSGVTLRELSNTVWPHPTFSEVIGEAVEDALGGSIHAAPKRKHG